MPYLSRIWMNPLRRQAQRFLRDPHALHAGVLGGLSRQPVTERVLWRLGADNAHRIELLVLTESTPSWEHLVEQAGWTAADEPQQVVRDYQPLLDRVQRGREFRLRLRANPVSTTRHPVKASKAQGARLSQERPRGVRVPHRSAPNQLEWFTSRIEHWGFELMTGATGDVAVQLIRRDRLVFVRKSRGEQHRVVLATATFDAAVRVNEPEAVLHHLLAGVGPAKSYGCGLITLAPAAPEPHPEGRERSDQPRGEFPHERQQL